MNEQMPDGGAVRLERLVGRVRELAHAVTQGREAVAREMTMRVPAEPDRDADLVLTTVADELERLSKIEKAARDLDEAMVAHSEQIQRGWNACDWTWAWDALALALTPNAQVEGPFGPGGKQDE